MTTAEGPGIKMTAADPDQHFGMGFILGHEGDHRDVGQNGSLLGYSGSLYHFPAEDLTVVVLTNTAGPNRQIHGQRAGSQRPWPSAQSAVTRASCCNRF